LSDALVAEGYPVQFVALSDQNATDFASRVSMPIFRDPSPGRAAWVEMQAGAVKHDTFVFDKSGVRTLFWDASASNFNELSSDLRAAVEAIGR
jgi:hypothetical protein